MEEMLGKFQNDLGNISGEIRALQDQSQSMSVRLRNRKAAELGLGSFLDSLALPAPLIDGILQPQSDVAFQAHGLRCIKLDRRQSACRLHIFISCMTGGAAHADYTFCRQGGQLGTVLVAVAADIPCGERIAQGFTSSTVVHKAS